MATVSNSLSTVRRERKIVRECQSPIGLQFSGLKCVILPLFKQVLSVAISSSQVSFSVIERRASALPSLTVHRSVIVETEFNTSFYKL